MPNNLIISKRALLRAKRMAGELETVDDAARWCQYYYYHREYSILFRLASWPFTDDRWSAIWFNIVDKDVSFYLLQILREVPAETGLSLITGLLEHPNHSISRGARYIIDDLMRTAPKLT